MSFDPKVINALARLRHAVMNQPPLSKVDFETLDNAGVFAALDEQTDYASAEDILAETALKAAAEARDDFEHPADPAVWGDTTSADVARRQGYVPALDRVGSLEYPRATPELDASDRAAEARLARRALGLD
jgi:hypothetical protein